MSKQPYEKNYCPKKPETKKRCQKTLQIPFQNKTNIKQKSMKQKLILVLIVSLLSSSVFAEEIVDNCISYTEEGKCDICSYMFVLKDNACHAVSSLCQTWNLITGLCESCPEGFVLELGICSLEDGTILYPDPIYCPPRAAVVDGKCAVVSDLCNTWDPTTALCVTCYTGYTNTNGVCSVTPPNSPPICPPRTVKLNGQCKQVSDLCNTWDAVTGACVTCYGGYKISSGTCVVDNGWTAPPNTSCPFRYVYKNGNCQAVSDLCNTWDQVSALCLTCYGGYRLVDGKCIV